MNASAVSHKPLFNRSKQREQRETFLLLNEASPAFNYLTHLTSLGLVSFGLIVSGSFAIIQSATGHFLPHDLRYLSMDPYQLCGLAQGRVAGFMFHDRVSFGGALIAIGLLYLWLDSNPLKSCEAWAWWTLLITGLAGFGSFLAYLGYGYLDHLHALATLVLLPLYIAALIRYRPSPSHLLSPLSQLTARHARPFHDLTHLTYLSHLTPLRLGRSLLVVTALGLILGGATIMLIGMTCVFVPQDLGYLKLGASDLLAINRRLLPLIAHDRAGFGGAIATCGLLLFSITWFARPSRNLWRTVTLACAIGFATAIVVHPLIGYNDPSHLAPAYLGAILFAAGAIVCHKPMCREETLS
ncbi:MAG: hypothetical protein C5B50_13475 [Verrucomicrobia bacterium]|nr:MAG: hypothetical protein C5B50_13475 [Verrucomicrobiota bacterium]